MNKYIAYFFGIFHTYADTKHLHYILFLFFSIYMDKLIACFFSVFCLSWRWSSRRCSAVRAYVL